MSAATNEDLMKALFLLFCCVAAAQPVPSNGIIYVPPRTVDKDTVRANPGVPAKAPGSLTIDAGDVHCRVAANTLGGIVVGCFVAAGVTPDRRARDLYQALVNIVVPPGATYGRTESYQQDSITITVKANAKGNLTATTVTTVGGKKGKSGGGVL